MEENKEDLRNQYSHDIETNSLQSMSFFYGEDKYDSDNINMSTLKHYIRYPMIYNKILRVLSKQAYYSNGEYSQSIDRMVALPVLSKITTLRNKSERIKKLKPKFNLFIKMLDINRTTRDILLSEFVEGTYVGILRQTKAKTKKEDISNIDVDSLYQLEGLSLDDNFMIQPLDLDYCKIIGFQNNVNIAAFDMMYFDQFKNSGLLHEIKNYPKEFLKAYLEYRKDGNKRWFTLDYKKAIVLKFKSGELEAYGVPLGIAALPHIKQANDYEDSQYKLIKELASSIYYMVLPDGEKKGSCSLNTKQQENLVDAFERAIKLNTSDNRAKISTLTVSPGTKIDRLSKDPSLIQNTLSDEHMKKISTSIGFAVSALNAEGKSGNFGSLQINLDLLSGVIFQQLESIGREITRVLNEIMGITAKDYIDIKFLPITWLNQKQMYDKAKDLYLSAGGSRKFYIACAGFDPDDYLSICDEEAEENLDEKYPPHLTSYVISKNDGENKAGKEEKDKRDLTQSGMVTRDQKSNEQRVRKNKK